MPKGIPLTDEEQVRRRREIFDAAMHLIIEKGFAETSMREIAEAAGTGKSTLYDYFPTKDDILLSFFEDELRTITASAEVISRQQMSAAERLRRVMQDQLEYMISNRETYLRLTIEAQRLSAPAQKRIQEMRHAYQDLIRELIEAGITEGSFRPVDSRMAMRIFLAAMTPIAFTTRPSGTPGEMLAASLDILFKGILA